MATEIMLTFASHVVSSDQAWASYGLCEVGRIAALYQSLTRARCKGLIE